MKEMLKRTSKGNLSVFGGSPKHAIKYSKEQIQDMYDRRMAKETWQSIANSYGVSRATIEKTLKRHTDYAVKTSVSVPKDYVTIEYYADMVGLSTSAIYYHIQKGYIKTIKSHNKIYMPLTTILSYDDKYLNMDTVQAIYDLKFLNWTNERISKALKISKKSVKVYLDMKDIFDERI